MTTESAVRETMEGTLESASDAKRGAKTVKVFEFRKNADDKYTTKVTWWPPREGKADPPVLALGARYSVVLEKKSTGEEGKFYRDFISAAPISAAAPGTAPGPGQDPAKTRPAPSWAARTTSIERQVALKAAVEVALVYTAQDGQRMMPEGIMALAERFAAFIAGAPQEQPQAAQQTVVEPKATPAFEDLGPAATGPRSAEVTAALARNDYSVFWPMTRNIGYPLVEQVAHKLGGMMPDRWIAAAPGRTLADAVKVLEAKP